VTVANWIILGLYMVVWLALLAIGCWWADRKLLEKMRRDMGLPEPQKRSIVGQSHKP
jgi:hypothetical protein